MQIQPDEMKINKFTKKNIENFVENFYRHTSLIEDSVSKMGINHVSLLKEFVYR